ncbi:HD domain-containing protein [Melioribacteraceae bacterium 4301-Me]|uniref:Ppx/GppA phosphatase family protein n=1 Tax=Pyranulibacter aquaticus TaxID=3163344 RepID=UPI00359B36D7
MNNTNFAAIDVGTNSFHLIVVNIKEDGNFEIIDREKEVIRLSEGSAGDIKEIKEEAMQRAITTLSHFKAIADSHQAKIRAVGTSAVREALNRNVFIERVLQKTGIEIEVVNGQEEARLIYLGTMKAVPIFNKRALVIDIGGGSTEFILGRKGIPEFSVSIKIGAVRLSQKFFPDYKLTKERIKECEHWVEVEIFPLIKKIKEKGFDICVGSSGTIMSTGFMILSRRKNSVSNNTLLNNFEFTSEELFDIRKEILNAKTVDKRKKIKGMDEKRADIFPAGIIILSKIFELFELKKMTISAYALREGIVIDTIHKEKESYSALSDIRRESVKHLMNTCNYDKNHCKHIASLSLKLFDQLKPLHKLEEYTKEYLEAAALLHDIGYHISHNNHHRHSYYIIKNSELLGFTENEIDIIANIARYHRKSHPKETHSEFAVLPEKCRNIVLKLSSILRIADAFDRTHSKVVTDIHPHIYSNRVELQLICRDGLSPDIELWSLERRKGLFEQVFNKKVVVKT